MLSFIGSAFEFNKGFQDGKLKDGYCQVYGQVGNEIIPLETLGPHTDTLGTPGDGKGKDYYLQRTFLVTDGVTLAQWFAGEYGAVLDLEDMPQHVKWERRDDGTMAFLGGSVSQVNTYYVRVFSVGKQVAEERAVPKWDFKQPKHNKDTAGQPFVVDLLSGGASLGNPSTPRKVTFVGADTQEYLRALQTALMVLVLSRADLPALAEIEAVKGTDAADKYRDGKWAAQGFAKTSTGLEDARGLLQRMYPDISVLEAPGQNPSQWRTDLYHRVVALSLDLYAKTGTNTRVERFVVEATQELRSLHIPEALQHPDANLPAGLGGSFNRIGVGEMDSRLLDSSDPDNPLSQSMVEGLAPNMFSTNMGATGVDELRYQPDALVGWDQCFVMYKPAELPLVFEESDPVKVRALLNGIPDGLRAVYTMFISEGGGLNVPDEFRAALTARKKATYRTSSGDSTPVCMVAADKLATLTRDSDCLALLEADALMPALVSTRAMLAPYFYEAALVLRLATAERAPEDGEWIAVRLFDTWPELEEFLRALENWIKVLAEAIRSMADAIIKYIEFLQAQIVELQQLIRRINALIQSFLSFSFALPQFSGLMLLSNGTDGILADFVAAKNKPSDSPLSYGAGVALVAPFAPGFISDIIAVATADDDAPATQNLDGTTATSRPPDAIGTEGVPPSAGAPPSDEPDVL